MRVQPFIAGHFYHIYVHTVSGLMLFRDDYERKRFLNVMFSANGEMTLPRLDRSDDLNSVWGTRDGKIKLGKPLVKIVCFCLMPTHLHLLLGEIEDGNISRYMHRITVSFAKYLNLKRERRGHVFESKFHSKLLATNEYLLRASCYIHLNPKDVRGWHNREHQYYWSSYQDYIGNNRWGRLLTSEPIFSQFKSGGDYKKFVEETRPEISEYASDPNFIT